MMRFVGFTTGGDLHPALKRFKILYYYNRLNRKGKRAGSNRVSVKFSSVIHLTVDDYYLRGFGLISISV